MKKYLVHIYEPTVYEVEAESEDEAKKRQKHSTCMKKTPGSHQRR